jgi:hypothetical protein
MDRLVRGALGPAAGRGVGGGISCIPTSDVGLSTLDDRGSIDVDGDESARSFVHAVFPLNFFQGRDAMDIGSEACRRCLGASSEPSEDDFLPASADLGCTRLGRLKILNKRGKGMGAAGKSPN